MSAIVSQPFPVFVDTDGLPLEGGFVYVGVANLDPVANPAPVFWDEALTIAAAQPLRTSAGVIVRSGAPALVYIAGDYSLAVKDANNAPISSVELASGLPSTAGSITLSSGESLTALAGSSVDLDDGSTMTIGDGTGVGVLVTVAANARIVGNLTPNVNEGGALGSTARRWASLNAAIVQVKTGVFTEGAGTEVIATDAEPFAEIVGQEVRATTLTGYADVTEAASPALALAFSQQKNIIACGRISSAGVVGTNHFNIASAVNAGGTATVTLDEAVEDDAVVIAQPTGSSSGLEVRAAVGVGGTTLVFTQYQATVLTSLNFAFVVIGRPRGGVANPIA
jgi:hypothetical protein